MEVIKIKEWFNLIKNARTSVDMDPRPCRPSTSQNPYVIDQMCNLIMKDSRLTVREIANDVEISNGSAHAILRDDLGMRGVAAKFFPKLLPYEHQDLLLDVAKGMLEYANGDADFLKTVITGDEYWVHGYDPESVPKAKDSKTGEEQNQRC